MTTNFISAPAEAYADTFTYDAEHDVSISVNSRLVVIYEGHVFRDSRKGASDNQGNAARVVANLLLWGAGTEVAEPLSRDEADVVVQEWLKTNRA